jgi:ankyrin repeat protein
VFDGEDFVLAPGMHTDKVDPEGVRRLAARFIAADFYSMDDSYMASVTDKPGYELSLSINGNTKQVQDYVGAWVGMPAVIKELEDAVDAFARTQRWIEGDEGLVQALQSERLNFKTFDAQVILKEAARRGKTATVRELLAAGVPLKPLPPPKPREPDTGVPFEHAGWLSSASRHPEVLQVLIDAAASRDDQADKDLALAGAARSGSLVGVRALIAYGANPNADFSKPMVTESSGAMTMLGEGAGSVMICAAGSGNPDLVREILRYHPKLEVRDIGGRTAVFAFGEWRRGDKDGARVECLRLLAEAGANVNARDNRGNTPLHETILIGVEAELLKLGADVNARNQDGETPIFTTVDDDAIPLFIEHGADLSICNNKGETVMEAASEHGPARQEALRHAIQKLGQH